MIIHVTCAVIFYEAVAKHHGSCERRGETPWGKA